MEKEFEIPYKEGERGVYRDPEDQRDFDFKDIVAGASMVDWENKNFKIECPFKVKNQNGSLSCVGQTASENEELLEWLETGLFKQFSAKDVYGGIYIKNSGGAYLRDAVKRLIDRGVNLEKDVPSYENGKPPSEKFMRDYVDTEELKEKAKTYKAKEYLSVTTEIDEFARAIEAGGVVFFAVDGDNKGWQKADVVPPEHISWGHAILGVSYGMRNGKKAIKFLNHWGEYWGDNGYGYIYEDYFRDVPYMGKRVTPGWVIIDQINNMDTLQEKLDADKKKKEENDAFLKKHDLKVVRNMDTGAFAWVTGGSLRVFPSDSRSGIGAIAVFHRWNKWPNISDQEWTRLPKNDY